MSFLLHMAAPVSILFMDHPSSFETDQKPPKGAMERTNMRFSKKLYRLKNKTLSKHILYINYIYIVTIYIYNYKYYIIYIVTIVDQWCFVVTWVTKTKTAFFRPGPCSSLEPYVALPHTEGLILNADSGFTKISPDVERQ